MCFRFHSNNRFDCRESSGAKPSLYSPDATALSHEANIYFEIFCCIVVFPPVSRSYVHSFFSASAFSFLIVTTVVVAQTPTAGDVHELSRKSAAVEQPITRLFISMEQIWQRVWVPTSFSKAQCWHKGRFGTTITAAFTVAIFRICYLTPPFFSLLVHFQHCQI